MGELMSKDVKCAPDFKATDVVKSMVSGMAEGDVVILENMGELMGNDIKCAPDFKAHQIVRPRTR